MIDAIGVIAGNAAATVTNGSTVGNTATSAFGLGFDALLKIILTQLTYQDPLKPMDNFQFVSQLAQFSQIQIGQTTNERLESLVTAQANTQASGLLGQQVDVASGADLVSGQVSAITYENGQPRLTVTGADGQVLSNVVLSAITQIRP